MFRRLFSISWLSVLLNVMLATSPCWSSGAVVHVFQFYCNVEFPG